MLLYLRANVVCSESSKSHKNWKLHAQYFHFVKY